MQDFLNQFFSYHQYIPHGDCYLWQPSLLGVHIIADGLIAIAYFSIPLILLYFIRPNPSIPFKEIVILFGIFNDRFFTSLSICLRSRIHLIRLI